MPTEPPSAQHNSGPPQLGQPPASAPHLQSRIGYPNHPQPHQLARQINPAHNHYGVSNSRNLAQMPPQAPGAAPQQTVPPGAQAPGGPQPQQSPPQQPQQQAPPPGAQPRQMAPTFYPVGSYPNNMSSYPQVAPGQPFPMGDFAMYQQPPAFMPAMHHGHGHGHGHNARPQPQQPVSHNQRPPAQFPTPPSPQGVVPAPSPRQHPSAPGRVPLPPPRKKIMRIVDPDTNEEVKVNKVQAKPSSPGSTSSLSGTATASSTPSSSSTSAVKIPQRKSRPLSLVEDPNDAPAKSPPALSSDAGEAPSEKVAASAAATAAPKPADKKVVADGAPHPASADVVNQPAPVLANSATTNNDTAAAGATVSTARSNTSHTPTQPRATAPATATTTTTTSASVDVAAGKRDVPRIEPILGTENETDSTTTPAAVAPSNHPNSVQDSSAPSSSTVSEAQSNSVDTTSKPRSSVATEAKAAETVSSSTAPDDSTVESNSSEPTAAAKTDGEVPPSSRNEKDTAPKANPTSVSNADTASTDMISRTAGPPSHSESAPPSTSASSSDATDVSKMADEFPRFADGERRTYPTSMLSNMKKLVGLKRATAFNSELGNLLKSATRSQDMRASGRPTRSQTNPVRDPRNQVFSHSGSGFPVPVRGAPPPGSLGSAYGSHDQIDLYKARSNAVPPVPNKHGSNRDGDPRGTRFMGPPRGGRMDGAMRSHGSLDQFAPDIPVQKLKRTENGWKRDREADDEVTAKVKQVRSLLNKLTLEKFEKIFGQIVDIDISNFETLTGVVKEIFEKTLFEPKFSNMYAELCRRLDTAIQPILDKKEPSGKLNFKKILLNNCKDEFIRFANSSAEKKDGETEPSESKEETTEKMEEKDEELSKEEKVKKDAEQAQASNAKKRMLANVQFISELFLKDLLRERIIHQNCILKLLSLGIEKKEEDVLEALCKLISKTGAKLSENKEAISHIDTYFRHLEHFSRDTTLPARIRFMVQDLIEQRSNNWKVRREEAKAKTISEIHKDIEKEERAKQEAAAAMKERRGRGQGGMHHRDRSGGSHSTRVHMTMAMNRPAATNVSRTTASLDKYASRATSGSTITNLTSIRLGPGGAKGGVGGSGLPSLRPNGGGSRFNVLGGGGQQSEGRDTNASAANSDPRRMKSGKNLTTQRRAPSKPESETPPEKVLDQKELRSLVQRKLKYYWLEKDLADTLELIDKEFSEANHLGFLREALKQSFEAKVAEAEASQDVFKGLVGTVINPKHFIAAFSEMVAQAPDLEMDNPRVLEFLGRYIGSCAATKKLGPANATDMGLGFLKKATSEYVDKKKIVKLVVQVFSSVFKNLEASTPDEEERKTTVRKLCDAVDVDLAAVMNSWNFMRGLSALSDMLKDAKLSFLVPTLETEIRLKDVLPSPTSESVSDVLKQYGAAPKGSDANMLMRVIARVSLEWFLGNSPEEKNLFKDSFGKAILGYYSGTLPEEVQMAVLVGAQDFFAKNQDTIPPSFAGQKSVVAALHVLYDADVVEEDAFLAWKDDTNISTKVEGKEKMLMDSAQFFKWLEEADEEE